MGALRSVACGNILVKLPERPGLHIWVRAAYWAALDMARGRQEADYRLWVVVGELSAEYPQPHNASPTIYRRSRSTSPIRSG